MSNKVMKKPGGPRTMKLDDRMKEYESVTTSYSLIQRLPVYVRIDGRAFHTFCRGLVKPFDPDFVSTMQKTCAYLVEKTNATVGYVQSDEISLCWPEPSKIPFETRLFKIESVFAAMATSAFTLFGLQTSLKDRIEKMMPHFDARCCQLPSMDELANMILFREMDCLKNSITMVALSKFSHGKLQNKNGDDKIKMLASIGVDYMVDVPEHLRHGSYFRRELYDKILTNEELAKIPQKNWPAANENGEHSVVRSHVIQFKIGMPLVDVENKAAVLFEHATAIKKTASKTNDEEN